MASLFLPAKFADCRSRIIKGLILFSIIFFAASMFTSCKKTAVNESHPSIDMQAQYSAALSAFYVNGKTGNDANDGKSLVKPWKTIQKAFNSATPGSVVFIRAGVYNEQLTVNVTGLSGSPITFMNYGNDAVVIDGTGIPGTTILSITDKSFLTFRGLTIQNLTKNNAQGILLAATAHGKASNITFSHINIRKINWTASATTIPNANQNAQGLIVYGQGLTQTNAISNLVIDSCEVSNNILGFSEAISLDGNIDGFTITHNKVHDNTNIGIAVIGHYGTSATASLDQTRNGVVEQNICFKNTSAYATSGGIYADGAKSVKIERNISYQNGYGVEVGNEENGSASNITVASNVLYFNQVAGLAIGGYNPATTGQVVNCSFYNNTFYKNNTAVDGSGEIIITKASNCIIENNVFYTNGQAVLFSLTPIVPQANNFINYNCWYTPGGNAANIQVNWLNKTYNTFASYQAATHQDGKSFFKDPLFKSPVTPFDFHLQSASPCIHAGNIAIIKDAGATDYDGNLLIQNGATTMGAYQNAL